MAVTLTNQNEIHAPIASTKGSELVEDGTYSPMDFDRAKTILNYQYANLQATQTAAYQSVSEIKQIFEDPDLAQDADSRYY